MGSNALIFSFELYYCFLQGTPRRRNLLKASLGSRYMFSRWTLVADILDFKWLPLHGKAKQKTAYLWRIMAGEARCWQSQLLCVQFNELPT